jgi:hypothetical protein
MTQSVESATRVEIRRAVRRTPPRWWARPWIIPLAVLFLAVLTYWINKFWGVWGTVRAPVPSHAGFRWYFPLLGVHMVAGFVAWVTAVIQLWPWVRRNHPVVHRVSGRIYVLAAVCGGTAALMIVRFAPPAGILGAVVSTSAWMVTTLIGFVLAVRGKYALHRVFMLYSFATFMAPQWGLLFWEIAQRTPWIANPQFQDYVFQTNRWVAWLINLMIVQWWLLRTTPRQQPLLGRKSPGLVPEGRP